MKITYHRKGDYLFPDLTVSGDEPAIIGKYGMDELIGELRSVYSGVCNFVILKSHKWLIKD